MAQLLCQVQWDGKKVVTTYRVLRVEPKDKIQVPKGSQPLIIQTKSARIVKRLGLRKAKNSDGRNDLYQFPPAPTAKKTPHAIGKTPLNFIAQGPPARTTLNCGTLDKQGHFVAWGPGFPLDK